MRTNTQTVTIDAGPTEVYDFVADLENLPRWAVGFAQQIRCEAGRWVVTSPQGDVIVRVDTDPERGIVDYVMTPAPGTELTAHSRVVPNEDGAEYVFTQLQAPGMPDDVFQGQIDALAGELSLLKDLLEAR